MIRQTRACLLPKLSLLGVAIAMFCPAWLVAAPKNEPLQDQPVDAGQVVTTGALSTDTVKVGESVRFWITVRNGTAQAICAVRLVALEADGYDTRGITFQGQAGQPDSTGASACPNNPADQVIANALSAGQTVTVWGDLRSTRHHEKQSLEAVVGWTNPEGVLSQNLVLLGQNAVQSVWYEIAGWIYGLIKDFALPVVLVALGFLFQHRDRKREHERQQTDKERDLKAETWKQMLPESHALAKEYYAPMDGAISGALQAFNLALNEPDLSKRLPQLRRTFYFVMLLGRCLKLTLDKVGGFYFKDRVGEQLASACCTKYSILRMPADPSRQEEVRSYNQHSLDRIDPRETFVAFKNKLDTQPADSAQVDALLSKLGLQANDTTRKDLKEYCEALQAAWKHFCGWYMTAQAQEAIAVLKALRAILNYEMNRPYEYWYDRREGLHLDEPTKKLLKQVAAEIASELSDPSFPERTEQYLREGVST